jgi:hypothetical protein
VPFWLMLSYVFVFLFFFSLEGILVAYNLQHDVVLIFPFTFTATTNRGSQNITV